MPSRDRRDRAREHDLLDRVSPGRLHDAQRAVGGGGHRLPPSVAASSSPLRIIAGGGGVDDVGRALTCPRDGLLPQQVGVDELQRTSRSSSLANASGRIFSLSRSTRVAIRHEETMLPCRFPPPLFSMTVGADCVRRRGDERSFPSEVAVAPVVVAALLPIRRTRRIYSRAKTDGESLR